MASSMSGQDEPNPALWLATHSVPQEKIPKKRIMNPLLTKLVQSRWLDIGLVLLLQVYGPWLCLGP